MKIKEGASDCFGLAREKSFGRTDGLPVECCEWVEATVAESIAAIARVGNAGLGLLDIPLSVTTTVTTASKATIGSFNRSSGEEGHSEDKLERG